MHLQAGARSPSKKRCKSEHAPTHVHSDFADTSPPEQRGHQAVPLHCLVDARLMRLQSGVAEGSFAAKTHMGGMGLFWTD